MSTLAHRDGVRRQGEMWPSEGRLCIKVKSLSDFCLFCLVLVSSHMIYAYFVNVPPV